MGAYALDEDNALYFLVNCVPGSPIYDATPYHGKYQIARAIQNAATKTVSGIEVVAGNCAAAATPANGALVAENPLPITGYPTISAMAVWEHGKYIFFQGNSGGFKILDGLYYPTSISIARGLLYQASTGKLYRNFDQAVEIWTPNLHRL